jgi:hypothetical protein
MSKEKLNVRFVHGSAGRYTDIIIERGPIMRMRASGLTEDELSKLADTCIMALDEARLKRRKSKK